VQRAVNTDKDVFKVKDLYYMCYQGVWFVGKAASGPWEVASSPFSKARAQGRPTFEMNAPSPAMSCAAGRTFEIHPASSVQSRVVAASIDGV
jgi:hypothetical protein